VEGAAGRAGAGAGTGVKIRHCRNFNRVRAD
jgi:hypothetical protein